MKEISSVQINGMTWNFFKPTFKPRKDNPNKQFPHIHFYAELFFCLGGTIQLYFFDEQVTLGKNDVCLVPSGISHTKISDASDNTVWGSVGVLCNKNNVKNDGDFDAKIASMLYSDKIFVFRDNPEFCAICNKLMSDEEVTTATTLELVCNFYKNASPESSEKIHVHRENNKNNIERLFILDHIINVEYMNDLSNKEIASRLSVSTRQLTRFVISNFGAPLHKLVAKKRLACAATQLVETDSSVEAICHSVGFSNKTFFYKKFKEEYGMTPVQYRKNAK